MTKNTDKNERERKKKIYLEGPQRWPLGKQIGLEKEPVAPTFPLLLGLLTTMFTTYKW